MNITFINRMMGIKFGGGENFDLNIAKALQKRGHNIRFVIGREWNKISLPLKDFDVVYIKTPYLRDIHYKIKPNNFFNKIISACALEFDLWLFENAVFNYLKKDTWSDVYQICGLPRLGVMLSGRKLITKRQAKIAIRWPGPPSIRKLKYMKKCDINFAHGHTMETLSKMVNCHNIVAGVDLKNFINYKKKGKETIDIVFVGRLIRIKRVDLLIDAFKKAFIENANIRLFIVGDGIEKDYLKSMSNSMVTFCGSLYGKKLYERLGLSDIFCITSEYESFSMSTIEAMSSSLPVIATDVGYLPKLVIDNGILIKKNSICDLKNAILTLANNKELREQMGKNGRKRVERDFSWDKSAEELEKLYQGI